MKNVVVIILLLFFASISNSFALSKEQAKAFLKALSSSKELCSLQFYREFKSTELKELALLLFTNSCFEKKQFKELTKIKEIPKNPYAAVEKAIAYKKVGDEKIARKIFKLVFSKTNDLDEWILTLNSGNTEYLFAPKVLKKKIEIALGKRNFEIAEIYLDYLKGKEFYHLLKGILYMKQRKKELAKKEFILSSQPKKFFYLTHLSDSSAEKFFYFKKAMDSNIPAYLKKNLSIYLLDRFLYSDKSFFRKTLKIVKDFDKELFNEYQVKYLVLNGKIKRALLKLSNLQGKKYKAWKVALLRKFYGKKESFNNNVPNFYSLLLNSNSIKLSAKSLPRVEFIDEEGIKYLYKRGRCDVISFINKKSPSVALAHHLCGDYKKAIKEATFYRKKLEKYPYLLHILYPKHPIFENDLISLSLARQESLFDQFALSRSGAIGLMQIMPFTGKYIAQKLKVKDFKVTDLFKPKVNYEFGSFYISELIKQFKLFPLAAASYNAGPTRIKKALKRFGTIKTPYDLVIFVDFYIPFAETRGYVKKVLTNYFFYNYLYNDGRWSLFQKEKSLKNFHKMNVTEVNLKKP
ncbi:Lytic transglycosylase catalytic [Desulfurobacterium thermolithotrophum DSM 11699]|uniref:Lytic transglycosylase catalytic n=1 Tax=Desulfurobacterium thermolithotrophum (strain DSM 11699 / BSA) TaxID=868864 RepID=F0S474_DESTD|nr:Lytic transglycosylase catalytic [Desulfurobacterium thermolithotrophum DSM 11699]